MPALAPLVLYGLTHRVPTVAGPLALFMLRRSLVTSWVWLFLIAVPAIFLCCYQLAYADLIAGVVSQLITVPISCTGLKCLGFKVRYAIWVSCLVSVIGTSLWQVLLPQELKHLAIFR